jgi:hypothetical protein
MGIHYVCFYAVRYNLMLCKCTVIVYINVFIMYFLHCVLAGYVVLAIILVRCFSLSSLELVNFLFSLCLHPYGKNSRNTHVKTCF